MYRKLQQQAKEYVLEKLNSNPDNLRFDIDTSDPNETIIICHSPNRSVNITDKNISVPDYVFDCIQHILPPEVLCGQAGWVYFVRYLFKDIFTIYGFSVIHNFLRARCQIIDLDTLIYGAYDNNGYCYVVTPFISQELDLSLVKLICKKPLSILLDPIHYFYCCSLVIQENNLKLDHTIGIHELFLTRFPEMNAPLLGNYLLLYIILEDYCKDMRFMVLTKLIDLYDYDLGKKLKK